jgi:hypothetical protein
MVKAIVGKGMKIAVGEYGDEVRRLYYVMMSVMW